MKVFTPEGLRATEGKSLNGLYKEAVEIKEKRSEGTSRSVRCETLVERSLSVFLYAK